jgi:hypothetical protein
MQILSAMSLHARGPVAEVTPVTGKNCSGKP